MRFLLLSLTYLALYGGLHAYVAHRALRAFPRLRAEVVAAPFAVLAVFPLAERLLERGNLWSAPLPLRQLAYGWMGFVFLVASLLLASDLLGWGFSGLTRRRAGRTWARWRLGLALTLASFLAWQAWLTARQPMVKEVVISSPKVPASAGEVRIVQLADIHLGPMLDAERLERIIALATAARPDLLVATGDVVDGQLRHLNGFSGRFARIPASLGKFAILGNHEFYVGAAHSAEFLGSAGFTMLRGERRQPLGWLAVLGVDDTAADGNGQRQGVSEAVLLRETPPRVFTLLLKHRPRLSGAQGTVADLQLSGHTHGGQLFPFGLLVRLFFPLPTGLLALGDGKHLYTSLGAGTWGPAMRLLAPPEVTLIRLRHGEG
ncbi:MAG: metallophosphoesterase [Thermodesulfobacteriota bacterium]